MQAIKTKRAAPRQYPLYPSSAYKRTCGMADTETDKPGTLESDGSVLYLLGLPTDNLSALALERVFLQSGWVTQDVKVQMDGSKSNRRATGKAWVAFRIRSEATAALEAITKGQVRVKGQQFTACYDRQALQIDDIWEEHLVSFNLARTNPLWLDMKNQMDVTFGIDQPRGWAMEPVHSVDGSASGGDRHVLLMERDPSLRAMHRDALLETDVQKAGLDMANLMEQYSVIMWPKLHPLFVSIVRQYEGETMAAELKTQLDRANTPEKRVKVVRSCVNLVTFIKYAPPKTKAAATRREGDETTYRGQAANIDQLKYGSVINALMLDGQCDLEFVHTAEAGTRKRVLSQRGPAAYAFGGGYRWRATHAVRGIRGERHVVLVRLDLPGRVGLVPMFHGDELKGYRRLDTTQLRDDKDDAYSSPRFYADRLVTSHVDYGHIDNAVQ